MHPHTLQHLIIETREASASFPAWVPPTIPLNLVVFDETKETYSSPIPITVPEEAPTVKHIRDSAARVLGWPREQVLLLKMSSDWCTILSAEGTRISTEGLTKNDLVYAERTVSVPFDKQNKSMMMAKFERDANTATYVLYCLFVCGSDGRCTYAHSHMHKHACTSKCIRTQYSL
jgi:hypothetical protein